MGKDGLGKTSAAYGIGRGFQTLIFESSKEQDILGEVFRERVSERLIWDIKIPIRTKKSKSLFHPFK